MVECTSCKTALDTRATFCPNCGATVPDPHIGSELMGRYGVDKRIAIGGFGSIYRAHELTSGRTIALKIMHRELAGDEKLVGRFRREGLVLRRLLNPHAVKTYELGETPDGLPFLAMELLEGETLLQLFRNAGGRLPWPRVFEIAKGVCSALGEAHGLGVVHRDLKPSNILVTRDGVAKVLDFGIAKILSNSEVSDPRELTIMGTAVGTLEYMAPEQLMGGKADPRTDIYTLGVLMYEVITGRRPYNAAGLDLLTEQLSGAPPPPSAIVDVPPEVDYVLMRCLVEDMDERFASAADLTRALDEALGAAPPPPPLSVPSSLPVLPPVPVQELAPIPEPVPSLVPRKMPPVWLLLFLAGAIVALIVVGVIVSQ